MAPLKQKGDAAELAVALDLRRRGYRMAFPFGEDCDYDLVVDRHGTLERVQVKYGRSDGRVLEISLPVRTRSPTARSAMTKRYTADDDRMAGGLRRRHRAVLLRPRDALGAGRELISPPTRRRLGTTKSEARGRREGLRRPLMEPAGLEPATSCVQSEALFQLSYGPSGLNGIPGLALFPDGGRRPHPHRGRRCSRSGWPRRWSPGGCACRRSCCSSASAWRVGHRRARLDRLQRLRASRGTIGIVALALILFEGGLTAGFGEIRPVLGAGHRRWRCVGTLTTAAIAGLAAAWLFGFSTVEGLLLGSILASTDSAAIFAVLRGSTLRRKLARTLEAEAGLNDPVAVVLVIGFVAWLTDPTYRGWRPRRADAPRSSASAWPWASASASAGRARCSSGRGSRRPACTRSPRWPSRRIAFGSAAVAHGSGFLAVYLAGLALGTRRSPGQADDHHLPPGPRLGRPGRRCSSPSACWSSPRSSATWRSRARRWRWWSCSSPGRWARRWRRCRSASPGRERRRSGWAGLRGAVPVVLATFPVIAGVAAQPRVLQHRLLRRAALDGAAGRDVRAAGAAAAGRHHDRGGAAGAAGRRRRRPPAGRRGHRVPRRATTTRSSAPACASSACRATRWSTSWCAASRRSRRAARRGSRRATGCTCSSARRPPSRSRQIRERWRDRADRGARPPAADHARRATAR